MMQARGLPVRARDEGGSGRWKRAGWAEGPPIERARYVNRRCAALQRQGKRFSRFEVSLSLSSRVAYLGRSC